ncbi:TlpA disulfide reductase family protein [Solimonas marina]|uniref:TlpA family protein disulfide reductase n=1 Tax=Solimonas marina TaxID=2714601 RepID=A0A969WCU2_9GAMM|nr:TlpA disulfide reductase family protein [Solimonas marina]NKF23658.1 TlpA family protein disulfide reductase [Solimonas marina]
MLSAPSIAAPTAPPMPGDIAPDAVGMTVHGRPVRISDYRGRVIVLTFWASWCAPCRDELVLLERLQRSAGAQRLRVIAVNWHEARGRFPALVAQLGPAELTLSSDADGRAGDRYGVRMIPRMFIIDRDGRVAYTHTGYDPKASIGTIVDEVNTLLAQTPPDLRPPP